MSGHSKWHKIRHKKAATDSKKSKLFGQLSREIKIAARSGVDPANNHQLREAIDRAKKMNLPQANIDRLLSATADDNTSITYEGYGPGGVAILIFVETDNTNRTVAEVRSILKDHAGSLGSNGSVLWKFTAQYEMEARCADTIDRDALELAVIDAGATDITWDQGILSIASPPTARTQIEAAVTQEGITIESSELVHAPPLDQRVALSPENGEVLSRLLQELEDHPDVLSVFSDAA